MFDEFATKRRTVSLTPLIDVVFLLLIFFMLTSSFLQTQSLAVVTPAPSEDELPEDIAVVEVWLLGNGGLKVDGEPVQPDGLEAAIAAAIGQRAEITVSVLAEPGSKTQNLVRAIEAARKAGASKVGTARVEKLE